MLKWFYEKPDINTSQKYLETRNYYWNSGGFCFKAGIYFGELQKYAPEIYEASKKVFQNLQKDNNLLRVRYEDTENFVAINLKEPFVYKDERSIVLAGIDNLIIVNTSDALLITKKGNSQKIKTIIKEFKDIDSQLHHIHLTTTHRPWGAYIVLEYTPGYKIKRIVVKPKKRLSLQKHFHSSEHWIVASGTATVTVGDKKHLVRPNEFTHIKMSEIRRLENEGKIDVVLTEAQVGEYTSKDDIVKIKNDLKRNEE